MTRAVPLHPHTTVINAPRELVYQMMSSFGRGKLKGDNNESSRVVSRDGDKVIAEFRTSTGRRTHTTLEEVTLQPPGRITFRHLEGPLEYAVEEFLFHDVDGRTELIHRGEFIWRSWPFLGWLAGWFYIRPRFERVLERHMDQIKTAAESRAARSHVFRKKQAAGTP